MKIISFSIVVFFRKKVKNACKKAVKIAILFTAFLYRVFYMLFFAALKTVWKGTCFSSARFFTDSYSG